MSCYSCLLLQDRVGGRIATFRKGNYVADLGAMVVTGLGKTSRLSLLDSLTRLGRKLSKIVCIKTILVNDNGNGVDLYSALSQSI